MAQRNINQYLANQIMVTKKVSDPIDETEDFKSFMNKFVLKHMLQNESKKILFLNKIIVEFNKIIDECNQKFNLKENNNMVKFVYKGGNLLRIHYNKFWDDEKVISIKKLVDEKFANDFSKSDDDFTILINPYLENFAEIHEFITLKSFVCLDVLRNEFENNLSTYFSYFNENDAVKQYIIGNYLRDAVDNKEFKSLDNNKSKFSGYKIVGILCDNIYAGIDPNYTSINQLKDFIPIDANNQNNNNRQTSKRKDILIIDVNNNNTAVYNSTNNHYGIIYNSHNSTLTFDKSAWTRSSFILNRTKINSRIYLLNNNNKIYVSAPGELIDVTIAKQDDGALQHMYHDNGKDLSTMITKYNFENKFDCYGYSFDYLIYDLEKMLFPDTVDRPWKDKKAIKRINRLFMVYFIKTSQYDINSLSKSLIIVKKLITNVLNKVENLIKIKNIVQCNKLLSDLVDQGPNLIKTFENEIGIFKKVCSIIVESYIKIVEWICYYVNDVTSIQDNIDESYDMINFFIIMKDNIEMLSIICDVMVQYKISKTRIPSVYIDKQFLGGNVHEQLYLTNKHKYKNI